MRTAGFQLLLGIAIFSTSPLPGADDEPSARRLKVMQGVIADFRVTSQEIAAASALEFVPTPRLRYSDPTRDLMDPAVSVLTDAGVWRVGRDGRPTALLVLEIYQSGDKSAKIAYEFISLSPATFRMELNSNPEVAWHAMGTDLEMRPLPDGPPPAASDSARLAEMRQLARRFTVREELNSNTVDCRLLPQPIDRYSSSEDKLLNGAIFVFANGTNPEAGVILETDGKTWTYGVFRLGAAAIRVRLDDREIASFPFFGDYGRRTGTYTSTSHAVELSE